MGKKINIDTFFSLEIFRVNRDFINYLRNFLNLFPIFNVYLGSYMGVNNFNIIFLVIFLSLTSGLLHNTKFNNFSTLPIHISKGISHNISFTMVENTKFYSNSPNILHNNDMDMVHKSFKSSLFNTCNLEKKSYF